LWLVVRSSSHLVGPTPYTCGITNSNVPEEVEMTPRPTCCAVCEDGAPWADAQLKLGMDEHGWMVQHVLGEGRHPGFAYTVGLAKWSLAEVLVYDLSPEDSAHLLNAIARRLVAGARIPDGAFLPDLALGGHCPRLFDVVGSSAPVFAARNLFGPRVRARQLVLPDCEGRMPWQRRYTGTRQPLHFTPPRE
jgi:hypothetical protein